MLQPFQTSQFCQALLKPIDNLNFKINININIYINIIINTNINISININTNINININLNLNININNSERPVDALAEKNINDSFTDWQLEIKRC